MRFLEFDANYQVFFSQDNPHLQAFESLQDTYSRNDNILIVLAPASGDVFSTELLATVEALTRDAWQIPHSRRVDSITNFQYSEASRDGVIVRDLVNMADTLTSTERSELRRIVLNEPLLVNRLVSPSGHVTGINVLVQLLDTDADKVEAAVRHAEQLAESVRRAHPDVQVYLTGGLIMDHAFRAASIDDMTGLVPAVYLIIVITMMALLRSVSGTLATILVIGLSSATGMGLAGWMGIHLTPPSVGAATIIMTLAVADSIHILTTWRQELERGADRRAALVESLRVNMQPVFLTSLTTAIGFLSMNFSDAPPFRDLGNITTLGVIAAYVYSITLLPALMAILPIKVSVRRRDTAPTMSRLAEFVIRNRRRLFWGAGLCVVVLASGILRIELSDQFVEYFDERVAFRRHTDFTMQNLTGIYLMEYSLAAEGPQGIGDPVYLRHVERFADWFASQPETMHINSILPILKRLNKNLHGDDPRWYRLPDSRELTAQYLLMYEMSLPYGLDLNDQINLDKSATRFTVTLKNLSTRQLRELERRAASWMAEHLPPTMQSAATSPAIMFTYISERNIRSMLAGSVLAVLLISLTLVVVFRSIKMGLLSMIPNAVPSLMAFGLWGFLVGQVGLVVSVVFTMALGIIVDDTVHFLSKYLRARREQNLDAPDAVRFAFRTVGTAMWITTVILIAGFGLLSLSAFELNAATGQLTAITIAFALAADFLFLPPLLMSLDRRGSSTSRSA